jgi:hypothetical protein
MISEMLFSRMEDSRAEAARQAGARERALSVAGRPVRLSFCGAALENALMPSLAGLVTDPQNGFSPGPTREKVPLDIQAWTGVPFPCPDLQADLMRYPEKVTVMNAGPVHLQFNPDGQILSCIDTERGKAWYYTPDPARLPDYEVCTPMRMIINWHCARENALMVHAAAVGVGGRGVLIIGRSGSGKSTTGLQCLLHGLDYLGDDYVALSGSTDDAAGVVTVHHLFRGCKVMDDALERLPQLRPHVIMHGGASGKNVMIANETLGTLVPALELAAIVRPRVAHADRSTFSRLPVMQAVTEFAGSTILQMPGTGPYMLKSLTALCARIPTWEMALGTDPAEIAQALRQFISTPRVANAVAA